MEKLIMLKVENEKDLLRLKKAVLKTKWFKRFELDELTLEILEEGYKKIIKKYPIRIAYIQASSENAWGFMIKETKSHQHVRTVIARDLYEGMCKSILVLYGVIFLGKKFNLERDIEL